MFLGETAFFRTLSRNIPNLSIFIVSPDMVFLAADGDAFMKREHHGYDAHRVEGRKVREVLAEMQSPYLDKVVGSYHDAVVNGVRSDYDIHRDGYVYHLQFFPVYDGQELVASACVARDVTDRRMMTSALLENVARLERANRDLRSFNRLVAHDLKEPCRTILAFAEMSLDAKGDGADPAEIRNLEFIAGAARRMVSLVNSLLEYTTTGIRELGLVEMDCSATILEIMVDLNAPQRANIEVGQLPVIRVDPVFRQVFQNLISNAMKYSANAKLPEIRIDCVPSETEYTFSVADNGDGIDPKFHEVIFDPFRRLNSSKAKGVGLGLALCKRVVERHHGRIWVESKLGYGSTFFFTVPR